MDGTSGTQAENGAAAHRPQIGTRSIQRSPGGKRQHPLDTHLDLRDLLRRARLLSHESVMELSSLYHAIHSYIYEAERCRDVAEEVRMQGLDDLSRAGVTKDQPLLTYWTRIATHVQETDAKLREKIESSLKKAWWNPPPALEMTFRARKIDIVALFALFFITGYFFPDTLSLTFVLISTYVLLDVAMTAFKIAVLKKRHLPGYYQMYLFLVVILLASVIAGFDAGVLSALVKAARTITIFAESILLTLFVWADLTIQWAYGWLGGEEASAIF